MILQAFAIYDNKALSFSQPFFSPNSGSAARVVMDTLAGGNSALARHPADYMLFRIGEYDDQNGQLTPMQQPENLGVLTQYMPEPGEADGPLLRAMGDR